MRSSTRRNVRLAQRRGMAVREGGAADLPVFYSLLAATGRRRGFSPPPASFFDAAWTTMAPVGMLQMAVAELDGEPVSAFLWVVLGDTMNCWRGGWSGQHRYRRPNEALDWSGITWAARQGLRWYDFQGDSDYTRGFSGSSVTSPGPLERIPNPAVAGCAQSVSAWQTCNSRLRRWQRGRDSRSVQVRTPQAGSRQRQMHCATTAPPAGPRSAGHAPAPRGGRAGWPARRPGSQPRNRRRAFELDAAWYSPKQVA
jgi:hypothetical protein